jgi:hypothetical protein
MVFDTPVHRPNVRSPYRISENVISRRRLSLQNATKRNARYSQSDGSARLPQFRLFIDRGAFRRCNTNLRAPLVTF